MKKPIVAVFCEWNDTPVSSASMGQVHWARLITGEEVAVKVLLPGVEQALAADLKFLKLATPLLSRILNFESLPYHFQELEKMFLSECDFRNEAQNYITFKKIHQDDPQIVVPKVFESISTGKVLVTEYIHAKSLDEWCVQAAQEERDLIAQTIWKTATRSINLYAQFNADPHLGNFLIAEDKVVLVDFGFCKKWSSEFIQNWKLQVLSGCANNLQDFEKYSKILGMMHPDPNYYKKLLAVYLDLIYEPYARDQEFQFSPMWLKSYLDAITAYHISVPKLKLPRDYLALSRLYWGMFGIMARLEAKGNFYRTTIPYIESPLREVPK